MRTVLTLMLLAAPLRDPTDAFWRQHAPDVFRAEVTTSKGFFVLEIRRDLAPIGVDRFYNLVRAGFFDDSRFYRVIAGRFAQFGIPGDPEIAGVWRNQSIPDDPRRESNTRGSIAYAMTGPNARTTQLYISLKDNSAQDEQGFAPIGKVVEGIEVVDKLYAEYGETAGGGMRGGRQGRIFAEGNVHLDRDFPKLDKLIRARVVPPVR